MSLLAAGCRNPAANGDASPPTFAKTDPAEVVVLYDMPAGGIVLGEVTSESPGFSSNVPDAMTGAIRSAAAMGANALVVVEERSTHGRDFIRAKAVRVVE